MSAPQFVPAPPTQSVRRYSSPPVSASTWVADRPGEIDGPQPSGERLGSQGPDQGYVIGLVERFHGKVTLGATEHFEDVAAGCSAVALRRAAQFGRAPVIYDAQVAFTLFGFFDTNPSSQLVDERARRFSAVSSPHHYSKLRSLVDGVPDDALFGTPAEASAAYQRDPRIALP